ncbi:MAG: hypothetical protein ACK50Q_09050 [Labrys sp. (in: a-proteobacteria)]
MWTAAGPHGTVAEYLQNTVTHLEAAGVRDHRLWALQARVAALIEEHWPLDPGDRTGGDGDRAA